MALESALTDRVESVQSVTWCVLGLEGEATSTDLTGTAFDEAVRLDAQLERIELKHTKALESHAQEIERQAGAIGEMDELILTCGREFSRVESDADNTNGMLLRFERQIEEHAARQDAKINELAKTIRDQGRRQGML
ncbi:hypothetical protein LRP88_12217 [Fusarium phalaenopsidis]